MVRCFIGKWYNQRAEEVRGKTFIAACLGIWWAVIAQSTKIIVCANDREQSNLQSLCDDGGPDRENPLTGRQGQTAWDGSGGCLSSDYKGAAGSRHQLNHCR